MGASPARRRQSGFGAVGGLVLLVFIVTDHFDPAIVDSSHAIYGGRVLSVLLAYFGLSL